MEKVYYVARFWLNEGHQTESSDKLFFSTKEKALAFLEEQVFQWSRANILPKIEKHPNYPDMWICGKTLYQIQEWTVIS